MSDSAIPADLRYSSDHEWVRADGASATVGITAYAQDALGDIVFVSLPAVGDVVSVGQEVGEIESTKSVSPLINPVSGTVTEVNADLDATPELVNSDPYGQGWMFRVELAGSADLDALMDAEAYNGHIA